MVNGAYIEDDTKIAEAFNLFFANVGKNLDKNIPVGTKNPVSFLPKNYNVNIFLKPTDTQEICKIIDKLKICAVGWDEIPSSILKDNKILF